MKTFGLFIVFFFLITIILALGLSKTWTSPEVIIESTILAYIMQQFFVQKIDE